jgi:hypothetical protein
VELPPTRCAIPAEAVDASRGHHVNNDMGVSERLDDVDDDMVCYDGMDKCWRD